MCVCVCVCVCVCDYMCVLRSDLLDKPPVSMYVLYLHIIRSAVTPRLLDYLSAIFIRV